MCLRFSLKQRGLVLLGTFKTVVLISLIDLHYNQSGLLLMRQYIPYSFNGHRSLLQISSTLKRESLVDSFPINTILIYILLFNMSKIVRTQLWMHSKCVHPMSYLIIACPQLEFLKRKNLHIQNVVPVLTVNPRQGKQQQASFNKQYGPYFLNNLICSKR